MNILIRLLVAVALPGLAGCISSEHPDTTEVPMTGIWEEEVTRADRDVPYSVLTVELAVSGRQVSGRYCFVTQFGSKIDCDPEIGENLRGDIDLHGDAQVVFDSSFGAVDGKAALSMRGGALHWVTVTPPKGGEFFGPDSAVMQRAGD